MPQLLTYHHREFPPDLHWQAVSLMRVEWPFIEGGLPKETYPAGLHPVHFVVAEERVLLSYAAVIRLRVEHGGEVYGVRGLGNVLTYPASRGKGYGRQVVDAATRYIAASDADVAVLFCEPSLEGFYQRSGWAAIRGAATLTGPREAPAAYDALRMMLFVSGKGKAGRRAFETRPLHIEHGW